MFHVTAVTLFTPEAEAPISDSSTGSPISGSFAAAPAPAWPDTSAAAAD